MSRLPPRQLGFLALSVCLCVCVCVHVSLRACVCSYVPKCEGVCVCVCIDKPVCLFTLIQSFSFTALFCNTQLSSSSNCYIYVVYSIQHRHKCNPGQPCHGSLWHYQHQLNLCHLLNLVIIAIIDHHKIQGIQTAHDTVCLQNCHEPICQKQVTRSFIVLAKFRVSGALMCLYTLKD